MASATRGVPQGDVSRVIVHFDYDCFYCAVFEVENPALRHVPFAVQQKQIIVTCNYEARRRGLHKLQLVNEAKRVCPNVVIRLGEDLDPFRAASKRLFSFLADNTWSRRAERLGFDEVWLDVTDMVALNARLVSVDDPANSFFHLDRSDPSKGFVYDATRYAGHTYPEGLMPQLIGYQPKDPLTASLQATEKQMVVGSHLARYLRHLLADRTHFTATVGVSVNKTLSKLAGNVHKPDGQTTLAPPYWSGESYAGRFMDGHDIGRVPGIGFKTAQVLRAAVLGREAAFEDGLVYGGTKEQVSVHNVRTMPGMSAARMSQLLSGPGAPNDIGTRIWSLLHGVDESPVAPARTIPTQISIEDSYSKLDDWSVMRTQLVKLATRLVERMRQDLRGGEGGKTVWLARPQTLRLTTRARPPRASDGVRQRSSKRVSKSGPMPGWVCIDAGGGGGSGSSDLEDAGSLAERLVSSSLVGMFKSLHSDRRGLDLSLINVAATNMVDLTAEKGARDISGMFRSHAPPPSAPPRRGAEEKTIDTGEMLSEAQLQQNDTQPSEAKGPEDMLPSTQASDEYLWDEDADMEDTQQEACPLCGAAMPAFAREAHLRYHEAVD